MAATLEKRERMSHSGTESGETPITVRRAAAEDAITVAALNADVQALHASLFPTLFKRPSATTLAEAEARAIIVDPSNIVLLAGVPGQDVGYAYAEVRHRVENAYHYAYDELYIHHLSVSPGFRRRGVGSVLVRAVDVMAHERGISRVALDVWTANSAASEFFRAHGFVSYNERLARGSWHAAGRAS